MKKDTKKKVVLSIIIPVFNEKKLLPLCLKKVEKAPLPKGVTKEIILIDDCSTDGTYDVLKKIQKTTKHKVYFHKKNRGKGGAVKTGFKHATGDIFLIQDADLEYDPRDYTSLITPIIKKDAKVVYGSRRLNKENKQYSSISFYAGGLLLSIITTILYNQKITDEPTCYKVFKSEIIRKMKINGERFEWEPEITAKILKQKIRIHEVPIKYYPRDINEGKKIRWVDGVQAIWTLLKYRFIK